MGAAIPSTGATSTRPTIFVLSELYWPEETSTGFLVTEIAEAIAEKRQVVTLCAQPTYSQRGVIAPSHEVRRGVTIVRCWSTRFSKDVLPLRALNAIVMTTVFVLALWRRVRAGDVVITLTNPPFLPYAVALAARMRRATLILLVHDVYPDVLVATGMARPQGLLFRMWNAATRWLLRRCDRICVLGRDVAALLANKEPTTASRQRLITNWADPARLMVAAAAGAEVRARVAPDASLTVLYVGNLGRTHDVELLLQVAATFREEDRVTFVFVGSGAKAPLVERAAKLDPRIRFVGQVPRAEVGAYLAAADVCVIPFRTGMLGVSVPSRSYDIMAVGTPMIVVADEATEVSMAVRENDIGWVVPCGDAAGLRKALDDARLDPEGLATKRRRSAAVAASRYGKGAVMNQYISLLEEVAP